MELDSNPVLFLFGYNNVKVREKEKNSFFILSKTSATPNKREIKKKHKNGVKKKSFSLGDSLKTKKENDQVL